MDTGSALLAAALLVAVVEFGGKIVVPVLDHFGILAYPAMKLSSWHLWMHTHFAGLVAVALGICAIHLLIAPSAAEAELRASGEKGCVRLAYLDPVPAALVRQAAAVDHSIICP